MDEDSPETVASSSQPCTPASFNPMAPSTSRVATPVRSSSRMSNRQYPSSPFRAQPQNMDPPNSRVQELRDAAVGKRSYTSEWMNNGFGMAPGMQQFQQYRPPSMIGSTVSSMSNMTEMTALSYGGLSVLSVNTDLGACEWYGNSHQALSRVPQPSSTENQDPMRMQRNMTVAQIVQNLRSNDLNLQAAALRELEEPMAKPFQLEYTWPTPDIQNVIYTLFEVLLPRQVEHENVIYKTLQLLYRSILPTGKSKIDKIFVQLNKELMDPRGRAFNGAQKPSSIFDIVSMRAARIDTRYDTAAACLLTHLCCKPYYMRMFFSDSLKTQNFQFLHKNMIQYTIGLLSQGDVKPKTRGFAVSIIKNLTHRNKKMMEMAIASNVIHLLLEIMKNEQIYEDLLWTTMRALSFFCNNVENGKHFIRLGGAQVLCSLLSHGSSRLLHELLGCMKQIADLPEIKDQNMEESIHCIVQLIGSSDSTIVERATATLRNIALHNKLNKTFMVNNGVTNQVLAVLHTSAQYTAQPHNQEVVRQQISSIHENCLSILNNVTSMSPQDNKQTAFEACRMISQNVSAAPILLNHVQLGERKLRKMAVSVMKRVIDNVPAFAEPFIDLAGHMNEPLTTLLLRRAVQSLDEFQKTQREIINLGQPQESPHRRDLEARKKDHEEIVKRAVSLVTTLCTKGNQRFAQYTVSLFFENKFNPLACLEYQMSDSILADWLTFIFDICMMDLAFQKGLVLHLFANCQFRNTFFQELFERRRVPQIQEALRKIFQLRDHQQQQMMRMQIS